MDPVLIMVAPTGARRTKQDHPALPITATEIAETARSCFGAGAGAIHVHVRDGEGRHSLDAGAYREAEAGIRRLCGDDIIVQATTESAGIFGFDAQDRLIRNLRPQAVSVAPRELFKAESARAFATLEWARDNRVAVQFILYDSDDVEALASMVATRRLPQWRQPRVILVIGRYGENFDSDLDGFYGLFGALRRYGLAAKSVWSVCAFGRGEMACLEAAMKEGGHARVGFENAITDSTGRPASDNASRVAMVADIATSLGRRLLQGVEARAILDVA